ncbi:MAG: methylated-DNA--[protein]-cysteine S-methyltransferase [Alphaproteobacteria bacterium]|nr:methylated-DNA--[protein]-cysteine S-methyltransferase [Alphaproteobacteria bacterium]
MPSPRAKARPGEDDTVSRLTMDSPLGALTLSAENDAITGLDWSARAPDGPSRPTRLLARAERQINAYFAGRLKDFDLPLATSGTRFQQRVWKAIRAIPYGTTVSYGELAKKLRSAPRPVAGACGANPIPIIIPCHRVLGAGGRLHGYSGRGGILTKATLLYLEGVRASV